MTPNDVQAAVLAFLDQFIGRGAAPSVVDLRERLSIDPETRQLLQDQLSNPAPSEREAFDAMRAFVHEAWERADRVADGEGNPDLVDLLSWTEWETTVQGVQETGDPAQWHDWLASVEGAKERPA
jgi:hypothetical protein